MTHRGSNHDILFLHGFGFILPTSIAMSSSQVNPTNGQYDEPAEIVTIFDDKGRELDCYLENELQYDGNTYVLLMPVDVAIVIFTENVKGEGEEEAIIVDDEEEITAIFDTAKAVLAELNLSLKRTGYVLTASGELPPLEEENIISLEVEEHGSEVEPEELQFLASFYFQGQKYNVCTPVNPILFIGEKSESGEIRILSEEDEKMNWIVEQLLFEEEGEN